MNTTEKRSKPSFSSKSNGYCLVILGRDRVAALRLIGPFRGSSIRLSIGILLQRNLSTIFDQLVKLTYSFGSRFVNCPFRSAFVCSVV